MFNFPGNKTPNTLEFTIKRSVFGSFIENQQKTRLESQFCQRHLPLTGEVGVTWFNSLPSLGGLEHSSCAVAEGCSLLSSSNSTVCK